MKKQTQFIMDLARPLDGWKKDETNSALDVSVSEKARDHFLKMNALYWSEVHNKYFIQHELLDFLDKTEVALLEKMVPLLPSLSFSEAVEGSKTYETYVEKMTAVTEAVVSVLAEQKILTENFTEPKMTKFRSLTGSQKLAIFSWTAIPLTFTGIIILWISVLSSKINWMPKEGSVLYSMGPAAANIFMTIMLSIIGIAFLAVFSIIIGGSFVAVVLGTLRVAPQTINFTISDEVIKQYYVTQKEAELALS